jgi:hypothetical protein
MADQQRYSEEEVHSILREALRLPSANSESGFSKEDVQRFAAEAGISDQALEQSLSKHRGRRRAHLIEYQRKTALTLDWELSQSEIDGIAVLCEALPPYAYKSMGNYSTIRIDQLSFFSMVGVLRKDGFTHISIDRQGMLELEAVMALFGIWGFLGILASSGSNFAAHLASWILGFIATLVFVVAGYAWRTRYSALRRKKLAELILNELNAASVN